MILQILGAVAGAAIGGWVGASRSCTTGTCPLTSNPYLGTVYGGLMGFLIVSALLNHATGPTPTEDSTMNVVGHDSVIQIASPADFKQQVLDAQIPVLVDLWATWCGPCRAQMPIVEQVADRVGAKARVVKVNVDDVEEVAAELGVTSIPTLIVFKGGKEQTRYVGVQSADVLSHALGV